MRIKKGYLGCLLFLMLLPGAAAPALMGHGFSYVPVISGTYTHGYVMARAQVVGPNGGPILIKVHSSGSGGQSSTVEVEEIGEAYAGGPLSGTYILSVSAYRAVLAQRAQLQAQYPERMARAEYLPAAQLASGLPLADGSRSPGVTLPDHIKTVVVWGRQDRLSAETASHIILTAPFQLDRNTMLEEGISSLLMNEDGSIRARAYGSGVGEDNFSVESFTWRTAFYAQPGSTEQSGARLDGFQDQIFGPMPTALLEQYGWFGPMYDATDADGRYGMTTPIYCLRNSRGGYLRPGMESSLILTIPTVPFNPNRMGIPPYYEMRDTYLPCSDNPMHHRIDFLIDVLWLVGELHLSNSPGGAAVPVGSSVRYEGQDRSGEPTVRVWDYDGDGNPDTAILANKITVTDPETGESYVIPEPASDGQYQAVYFSSGTRDSDAEELADRVPDIWRVADRTLDGRPTGLLTEISEDALRHTDVYIFRESTGELLVEVSGLPEGPYAGRASRIENNAYLWHTLLRGRESIGNNFAAYGASFTARAGASDEAFRERSEELGFSSRYQSRDADMPSPGEMLHVVAVNRVTGYTGSTRFELGTANTSVGAQQQVPRLELLPPNVKVWAQRLTEIEAGLTAGEQREYLISHEGAHTANDLIVGLYTDWRAADGSPLPNALGRGRGSDFGLTGRLAKVRDGQLMPVTAGQALNGSITLEDALAAGAQGAVAEFPVAPGQNLQLLRLPSAETGGNEHYYVNLFGRALNKEVCSHCQYDQSGMHPTLAGRPNHFAPLYVPRYDQVGTDALRRKANDLADQSEDVDPQYLWTLRPEYHFSQIDFRVDEIEGVRYDNEGREVVRNLLQSQNPLITSSDDLIRVFYDLFLPGEDPLSGFDGQREYILALGEEEVRISAGGGQVHIWNLADLERLTAADHLTLRLYLAHDAENVLWEWAYSLVRLIADMNRDGWILQAESADGRPDDITNSERNPLRIWINDDTNHGDVYTGGKGRCDPEPFEDWCMSDVPGSERPDYEREHNGGKVSGMRDLVDFFPVLVDVEEALREYPSSDYIYRLRHADAALNFFEALRENIQPAPEISSAQNRVDALLRKPLVAAEYSGEPVRRITDQGVELSADFLAQTLVGRGGIIYIEGRAGTEEPLTLEVISREDGEVIGLARLALRVSPIEDMYRHINMQVLAQLRGTPPQMGRPVTLGNVEPPNNPDAITDDHYFVFIHGYNVSGRKARGWHAQMFKRLHRLGYNGRFVGITWHGDTGLDYHKAVYNAFVSSQYLNEWLLRATGKRAPVTVAAHSLGNVLASSAIADYGLEVDRYLMLNAAVPIEAYDPLQSADEQDGEAAQPTMTERMTEIAWQDYDERFYASNWHKLFEEGDPRGELTWGGVFSGVLDRAYNFYSTGEEVLQNPDHGESGSTSASIWTQLRNTGQKGTKAWVAQEMMKGCRGWVIPNFIFENCGGGWGFNDENEDLVLVGKKRPILPGYRRRTGEEANAAWVEGALTNEHLAQVGIFKRWESWTNNDVQGLYAPITETSVVLPGREGRSIAEAGLFASQKEVRWDLLASSIPAKSSAAGANAMPRVEASFPDETKNFNLQEMQQGGLWPASRLSGNLQNRWAHSDIRDIALPYVAKAYDRILGLPENEEGE